MSTTPTKDIWDKMQASAALIASIFVPLAVAIVGNSYSHATKEAENRLRYVEISIGILQSEPNRETAALREWAVQVLDSQATVRLSQEAKEQLKNSKLSTQEAALRATDAAVKAVGKLAPLLQ